MFYKRISDLKPLGRPANGSNWNNIVIDPISETDTEPSALQAKSMWMAVAISKDKDNKPTGNLKNIDKFETKRLNVYNFIKAFQQYSQSQSGTETSIITTDVLSANIVSSASGEIYLPGNKFPINGATVETISSDFINIGSGLTTESITAQQINEIDDANIEHISGSTFNFSNIEFDNLSVKEISSYTLDVNVVNANDIDAKEVLFNNIIIDTATYKTVDINKSLRSDLGNISEMFHVNTSETYEPGTLIRFGKHTSSASTNESDEDWEITLAKSSDSTANGVIGNSDECGIILNNDHGNEYKPVVLLGITKVNVLGPNVNIGDKLYLSNSDDGVASIDERGKAIGIALEAHNSAGKKLINCFVKFNVE